ncbi:MAG: hypothetical protein K0R71_1019 [Bacillales bacterium]|jgi:hypothetical protein|nr:hypothetical protein [Bacillales bacterium]
MADLNQNVAPQELQAEQKPFRKEPAGKKTSKEMIILILLVLNIILSTISLAGVAYTVSIEKDRADQVGNITKNGGMLRNGNGQFFQRGQIPNGDSNQVNPQGGSTN